MAARNLDLGSNSHRPLLVQWLAALGRGEEAVTEPWEGGRVYPAGRECTQREAVARAIAAATKGCGCRSRSR
jgi:hypothetical protein